MKKNPAYNKLSIAWPLMFGAAILGLLLSWLGLSGDQLGRVNLFYLLFVYLLLPVLGVLVSCVSLLFGKGVNLASMASLVPLWSKPSQTLMRKLAQHSLEKPWLFYQSQLAAMAFSLASVLVFFLLLLTTDINFVWRSTILQAGDIYPLLDWLAVPWFFWEQAQPSVQLLELTQDSRLNGAVIGVIGGGQTGGENAFGDWWRFILAVQIFYCLVLRSILLVVARFILTRGVTAEIDAAYSQVEPSGTVSAVSGNYKSLVLNYPSDAILNNWARIPLAMLSDFLNTEIDSDKVLLAGPLASEQQQLEAESCKRKQLLLVKAWEPPLGELEDYLGVVGGYIFPMDWSQNQLQAVQIQHLQEWQRFVETYPRWQIVLPEALLPKDLSNNGSAGEGQS